MLDSNVISALLILVPILILLVAGAWITVASDGLDLWTREGRRLVLGNFSHLLVRLAGLGAGLAVLQKFVGQSLDISW
jgi:hypothetical protein